MSSQDQGLLVFGTSGTDHVRDAAYDSRLGRMNVDLTRNPAHLAIIDNFPGGSALTLNPPSTDNSTQREVLLRIKHGLPFIPEALVYFYVKSIGGNPAASNAGQYGGNIIFYSGSAGTFEDVITIEVDETELRIVHILYDFGFQVPWTSPAPSYLFRLKYYIFSNDSHAKKMYTYADGGLSGVVG